MKKIKFQSQGSYFIDRNKVFTVKNPIKCYDFSWLIGQQVRIDGLEYIVIDVVKDKDLTIFNRGSLIDLIVQEIRQGNKIVHGEMIRGIDYL